MVLFVDDKVMDFLRAFMEEEDDDDAAFPVNVNVVEDVDCFFELTLELTLELVLEGEDTTSLFRFRCVRRFSLRAR